jgi:hypothetical protein
MVSLGGACLGRVKAALRRAGWVPMENCSDASGVLPRIGTAMRMVLQAEWVGDAIPLYA